MTEFDRKVQPFLNLLGWAIIFLLFLALTQVVKADYRQSVCRISNAQSRTTDLGSGTLIEVTPDGREGLVLTCYHLFRDGKGTITCEFPDGSRRQARLLRWNEQADLATLSIAKPTAPAVPVLLADDHSGQFNACGFGSDGRFSCTTGRKVSTSQGQGRNSLIVNGAVRSGDSGGGVFNEHGQLVAVVWGAIAAERVTYASYGAPLESLLVHTTGRQVMNCPNGRCLRPSIVPSRPVVISPPVVAQPPRPLAKTACDCKGQFTEINRRISVLESTKAERGPAGQDGKDGRDGKDAVVDHEAIAQAAAAIVLQQLPKQQVEPFHIRVDRDAPYRSVKPGQYVTLPLSKAIQAHQ